MNGPAASLSSLPAEAYLSLACMEGMPDRPLVETAPCAKPTPVKVAVPWHGYALAVATAAVAYAVHLLPFAPFSVNTGAAVRHPVSADIIAIVAGVLIRNLFALPPAVIEACKRIVKRVLPLAVVFAGAGLNLFDVASVGVPALVVTMTGIGVAIAAAYYGGRLLGVGHRTALLIGAGTGICGNSAIAAVAPLTDADDDDLMLSLGTINLFGLLVMLVLPVAGRLVHLSDQAFGIWAGASVHAVPQAVATGFAYSSDSGTLATLVKLVRVALLAPLVFIMTVLYTRRHARASDPAARPAVYYARMVPWFIWGFVGLALLNSLALIPRITFDFPAGPAEIHLSQTIATAGKLLLTLATAAIGLEVNIRLLAGVGGRAIATGFVAAVALGAGTLLLILLMV